MFEKALTRWFSISRIDPQAETQAYTDEVMATVGAMLDEQGRALLEEDLRSPYTEETLYLVPWLA